MRSVWDVENSDEMQRIQQYTVQRLTVTEYCVEYNIVYMSNKAYNKSPITHQSNIPLVSFIYS